MILRFMYKLGQQLISFSLNALEKNCSFVCLLLPQGTEPDVA